MVAIKSTIKAMCKAFPGGRSGLAGALGMTLEEFNNNLYEKNRCRFFEVAELEAMEDLSGTNLLADYFARRRGQLLVDVQKLEDLDQTELFNKSLRTAAFRGRVDLIIQASVEDGIIDDTEAAEIMACHRKHLAAREEEVRATIELFRKEKARKVDALSVQLRASGALTKQCGVINA
jgi:hypothetical protein